MSAKYRLLQEGETILETDEYYNPYQDKWLPVISGDFIGIEFYYQESKPVRRLQTS